MKIHNANVSIYAGDSVNSGIGRNTEQNSKVNNKKSIFAGNLNICEDNTVLIRKEAMKKALKVVGDAFKGDCKIDDDLENRRSKVEDLKKEIYNAQKEINILDARKSELKEIYGITDDSQEQKDLQLLLKRRDWRIDPSIQLTDEERQCLARIDEAGMTEYQQSFFEIDALIEPHEKVINDIQKEIVCENKTIEGIKLERLKINPMLHAKVAAEDIMDVANNEIIGLILDEGKDHIDQKIEEEKELADKKAEEKNKQEEKTEAVKEKKEAAEALANKDSADFVSKDSSVHNDTSAQLNTIEQFLDFNETINDIQREVQDIIDKMKLLQEDIKGAAVDANI